MFGLGTGELVVIFLILLLVFGANRLPKLGKALGEGITDFRKSLKGTDDADGDALNETVADSATDKEKTET